MDVIDLKSLYAEVNKGMAAAIEHVKHELAGVRTGRASVTILDGVHVEAYGSKMPLNQIAGLSVPEPTLIVAQPFDPSQLGAIEKAVRAAGLGLNPANDGKVVRIPIPPLTEGAARRLAPRPQAHRGAATPSASASRRQRELKEAAQDHKISEDDSGRPSTR